MFQGMQKLQQAIYQLLTQDTLLMQQVEAVYDGAPLEPQMPCVLFGKVDAQDWSTKTAKGAQIVLHVHVLTDQPSRKEGSEILDRVQSLLETGYISLSNLNIVAKRVENAQADTLEDDVVGMATLRLRAFTEAA